MQFLSEQKKKHSPFCLSKLNSPVHPDEIDAVFSKMAQVIRLKNG